MVKLPTPIARTRTWVPLSSDVRLVASLVKTLLVSRVTLFRFMALAKTSRGKLLEGQVQCRAPRARGPKFRFITLVEILARFCITESPLARGPLTSIVLAAGSRRCIVVRTLVTRRLLIEN